MRTEAFISLVIEAFGREVLKKLVFSRPHNSEISKVSGRMCTLRGENVLSLEYSLPGNTVSHKNLPYGDLPTALRELIGEYRQANLITTLGDAEWKLSGGGKEALLGEEKLRRKLSSERADFEKAIEELDVKKSYMLKGDEDFLIKLGISDKNGRIHDKRRGKFRQINRFLEIIDDVYDRLPESGELIIYDLCCGKSYLSFAVYYYFTAIKGRKIKLLGIDLKRDVIAWCGKLAEDMGFGGMTFLCDDVKNTPRGEKPNMVISLHACDIATDVVINRAIELSADLILSTPCCHRYLNDKIVTQELSFVTKHGQLRNKLCEAITDGIRLARLEANGYSATALELTDPDDTPKNTLLRAIRRKDGKASENAKRAEEYEKVLAYLLGDSAGEYLKGL